MHDHRLAPATTFTRHDIRRPFSNFDFVENNFLGTSSIRRLFSQARSYQGATLVIEDVPATGIIAAENEEIVKRYRDHAMTGLKRLTFWKCPFTQASHVGKINSSDLIGYAILKRDVIRSKKLDRWHVFESVFVSYPHRHNCIHGASPYIVRVADCDFSVTGVMYCQQNSLNKACAQVALRSLCTLHRPDTDLPYDRINTLAAGGAVNFDPAKGLDAGQIRSVLKGLGIGFTDVDYTQHSPEDRKRLPFQKFLYAGIESDAGAMLGFKLTGPQAEGRHIIPFFGHTFNQDTWVPNAETAYFHVGDQTRYIPSETWVSSFIGHDDNFGSNFCVPRLYVTPEQADYVVALQRDGVRYSGTVAEAVAAEYLYSLLPRLDGSQNRWLSRLIGFAKKQEVILRAVALTSKQYSEHLRKMRDWESVAESEEVCNAVSANLPAMIWSVEVSIPELFPINLRKLGEIVLDATKNPPPELDFSSYLFGRFPGCYVFFGGSTANGKPQFISIPGEFQSHTPLYGTESSSPMA